MSVRSWHPVAAVAALVAVALAVAACSGSAGAGGDGAGGGGAVAPAGNASSASSAAPTDPTSSAGATSQPAGAPITVVALPTTGSNVAGSPGAGASTAPQTSSSGQSGVVQTGTTRSSDPSTPAGTGSAHPTTSTSTKPMPPAATVTGSPALGSKDVAPADQIRIKVSGGTISWLTFTNADGKKVRGTLSRDRSSWTLDEPLGYGKTYTVTGVALNRGGVQTKIEGSYRTATTVEPVTTSISPGNGAVVGVAAPVIVSFGLNPQDKALIEKPMTITSTPKVEGSWAWITHDGDTYPSLDFRPKSYWPSGTKVHVESNIYGVKFADGWYGGDDVSVDFTIGRNQVVIANAKTHRMTVKRDGKTIWTFDASMGMGDDPNSEYGLNPDLVTRSGIHVVMGKSAVYKMSNPKYGYTNVSEYWAVRISDNGEFIHNNPGTTAWELANVNKTHGCVNLSWDDAKKYYDSVLYGDPVDVIGTSVKLGPSDGDIYDWAIPWSTWKTMSALAPNSIVD